MTTPPLNYRIAIALLSPILTAVVLWQALRIRSARFAKQRLGFGYPKSTTPPLWIHCASVGEVMAAKPLIVALAEDGYPIVVTTATPTGAETAARELPEDVTHLFMPIDTPRAVGAFIQRVNPRCLLIMETEIWPHVINHMASRQRPVAIVNARLSARTLNTPNWLQAVYAQSLQQLSVILAKSSADAEAYISLGADAKNVQVLGNLKYAALASFVETPIDHPFADNRRFWLAASTHEDEEQQLCAAMLKQGDAERMLLVIAPRHPKRSAKIQQQLSALGITFSVRSQQQAVDDNTQVYLADTLGEMQLWLQHAELVFMGGSLVPVGGHNLLEPAAAACVIIAGQHLQNFAAEANQLRDAGALRCVNSAEQVLQSVNELSTDPNKRSAIGNAARESVQSSAQVMEDYLQALHPILSSTP